MTPKPGSQAGSNRSGRRPLPLVLLAVATLLLPAPAQAQVEQISLTVDRMVELTLDSSYRMQFLNMSVERQRLQLRAERARLRSNVSMNVSAPDFQSVSETQYNSATGLNEVVSENSRRWEAQLSIEQPVIVFGYPTNGYLSLNNRVYRYLQLEEDGDRDLTYYNRYFVRYRQPLFQPNGLKNDLEQAELNVEDTQFDFFDDVMSVVEDAEEDYLDLFENAYEQKIYRDYIAKLERALSVAQSAVEEDPGRSIELDQIRVELNNAREQLQSIQSQYRLETSRLKTSLNLEESVEIVIPDPSIAVQPVQVDLDEAVRYARELTPRLRQLQINRRQQEMRIENSRGRGGFRMNLEFTYGKEMRDPLFDNLLQDPSNTYTIDVSANIPIWDWGERKARLQADEISLRESDLRYEQAEIQQVSDVQNEVRNVTELQDRALGMVENLDLATDISEQSFTRYQGGSITVLDLLQSLRREADTAENLLESYMNWRESLRRLRDLTYFDYEAGQPIQDRWGHLTQ